MIIKMNTKWADSYKYGQEAEKRFAKLLPNPIWANRDQNMHEHWDVANGDSGIRYDVKAMKRVNKSDKDPTDLFHWIELKNVNVKAGWLYGEADYFSFETKNYWLLVPRQKLQIRMHDIDMEKSTILEACTTREIYKLYTRPNRKDLISLIPIEDIDSLSARRLKTEFYLK